MVLSSQLARPVAASPAPRREHSDAGPLREHGAGFVGDFWGYDDVGALLLHDRVGGFFLEGTVECDDAAKGGGRIGTIRVSVGGERRFAGCDSARIRVLDDHAGGGVEAQHALQRGISVREIVERQLLALQLRGSRR